LASSNGTELALFRGPTKLIILVNKHKIDKKDKKTGISQKSS